MATLDVLVGRQPIFDRDRAVIGYELLFRALPDADATGLDGDELTSGVVFGAAAIGIDRLVGDKLAFLNADYGLLSGAVPMLMPAKRTVIEVLETVRLDAEVLAGARRLRDRGYQLALDDFAWCDGAEALLDLATIVKIDIQAVPPAELPSLVRRCRQFAVTLLAEKVETADEMKACEHLGFELFQGYLLARPDIVPGHTLDSATLSRIQLAAALVDEQEFKVEQLEQIVRTDPSMAVQLLQLASVGADHGMRRSVASLHDALILLGWRQLQRWIGFLLLIQRGHSSEEQITVALTRARMCEVLSGRHGPRAAGIAFTAGMLSALDLLFNTPLETILDTLCLSDELHCAALGGDNPFGQLLRAVIDHQRGLRGITLPSGLSASDLDRAAGQALAWAIDVTQGSAS